MSLPTSTLAWIFQNPIVDTIDLTPNSPTSTFGLKKLPLPSELPDDSALLKTLYLSNDPALRISIQADAGAINRARKKTPGAEKGAPMNSLAVLRVLKVGNDGQDSFKEGDIVWGLSNWSEYVVLKKAALTVVQYVQITALGYEKCLLLVDPQENPGLRTRNISRSTWLHRIVRLLLPR